MQEQETSSSTHTAPLHATISRVVDSDIRETGTGRRIATVHRFENNQAEVEANARLFASAPDLLEAAKAVREFSNASQVDHGLYVAAARKVEAAIAKAEGRE